MFTQPQRAALLALARASLQAAVREHRLREVADMDAVFQEKRGAFVTLTHGGALRGCIGFPQPDFPLYQAIIQGAAAAALQDPRFPPVHPGEVEGLHIEISVLSPLAPITPDAVEVGTHGLVVEHGHRRGLLLPQVPVEWGWDRETFLAHTCRKAGLPSDAWKTGATLYAFTAEVFGEGDADPWYDTQAAEEKSSKTN